MTSFSHCEVSHITQKYTICQMVDFQYNMDIYDKFGDTIFISLFRIFAQLYEIE